MGILASNATQQFPAIQDGKHQIKNQKIVVVRSCKFEAALPVARNINCKSLSGQSARDEIRNFCFVFYQKNSHSSTSFGSLFETSKPFSRTGSELKSTPTEPLSTSA